MGTIYIGALACVAYHAQKRPHIVGVGEFDGPTSHLAAYFIEVCMYEEGAAIPSAVG